MERLRFREDGGRRGDVEPSAAAAVVEAAVVEAAAWRRRGEELPEAGEEEGFDVFAAFEAGGASAAMPELRMRSRS